MKLVVRDEQGQLSLDCPTCRQATPIPANGVAGLQSAFHINHLLEIRDSVKEAKTPAISQEVVKSDKTHPIPKVTPNCFEHADKERELYCETCEDLICLKCAIKGGKHQDHNYQPLNDAFEKYKSEMTSSLEPMEKKLATINEALRQLDKTREEISNQQSVIKASINDTIGQLHEVLEGRRTELIGELDRITQRKLKGLAIQRDQMETTLAQLRSSLAFIEESMKTGIQEEMLMMKSNAVVKQIKELSAGFQPGVLKPDTEADIIYTASANTTVACQNYGQIYSPSFPDPSKCYVNLKDAVVGKKSTAIMFTLNYEGEPCTKSLESLQCELESEITGTIVRGTFEKKELNQYEISYQPTSKGRHQLCITVDEQHIRGSPFAVPVKLPVKELRTPIQTIDGLNRPWGVAVSQRGEVVVSENYVDRVSIFSPRGEKLQSFGTSGRSDQGQFKAPRGVAFDSEGNILVADNHRIQKFTMRGRFLATVGTEGNGPLQFKYPYDITFNVSNNKIYVSDENHRIQILNSDLTFFSTFGRQGIGKGQFNFPRAISCDSTGRVYVADSCNHRIQVFTAEGKFLKMLGQHDQGKGELHSPANIAIDTDDILYVSDHNNDSISVFTSEGYFMSSFGRKGKELGMFSRPSGLAVDNSGVLYVCDFENKRIQVF